MKTTTTAGKREQPGPCGRDMREGDLALLDAYTDCLAGKNLSDATVLARRKLARRFLRHLYDRGVGVEALGRCDIAEYWISAGETLAHSSMADIRGGLASLLPYLAEIGITDEDLSVALPTVAGRTTRIKSLYTDGEIEAVLSSIDRSTDIGKRDYAMIMLGATTALRALDVIRLKVTDIDWGRSVITLVLHKSRRLHAVPLLPQVGNAVLDYLLNARPDSDSPCLFLATRPPFKEFSESSCCAGILKGRMKRAGIDIAGRASGFHVFRVRAASKLLAAGTPLADISGFLGHGNPKSIKPYLSVDKESLRACCLPFNGIEERGLRDGA